MLQRVKDDQKSKDEEKVAETKTTKSSEPAVDWLKSDFPTAKAAKHWDESDSEWETLVIWICKRLSTIWVIV